ncbi:MAG TPA: hypothetical protein VHJ54_06650 [Solirubrobacterales bacterium]|nr:hypothetical protein [Solirubrobacterales bacterium]
MRRALNENPVAQAALVGLLVIAVAFLLLTRVMKSNSGAEATESTTESSVATAPAAPAPAASEPAGDFVAGPGLPKGVVDAYGDGKAVVLLVTRKAGIEDKRLRAIVGKARSVGNVAVFTTNARGIARYARIAGGVDVSRVPALVVIRPRRLSDGMPEASVSYGFRGPDSVQQAVRDALYDGKSNLPYYPE